MVSRLLWLFRWGLLDPTLLHSLDLMKLGPWLLDP